MNTPYTPLFYAGQSSNSLTSARVILPRLFSVLAPASVADIGCGVGPWLRAAQELGAEDVLGIDGDYVDRDTLLIPPSSFVPVDVEKTRLRDVPALEDGRRFDLVISVEVAEHLTFARAPSFVDDLVSLGDVILFSAAVPFQGGEHHVNEQWPEYWATLFRAHGYACLDIIRPDVWGRTDVDWWYAQNALVFVREGSAAATRLAPDGLPEATNLALVHPKNYLAQITKWFHIHRYAAAAEEEADLDTIVAAFQAGATEVPPLAAITRAEAHPGAPDVFPHTRIARSNPEADLAQLHDRAARAECDLVQARDRAGEAEAERASLVELSNRVAGSLDELARTHALVHAELADFRIRYDVLEAAHAGLQDGYRAQQAEKALWEEEKSRWEEERARWQDERSAWQDERAAWKAQQDEWQAERADLEGRIRERMAMIGTLREDLTAKAQEAAHASGLSRELEAVLFEVQDIVRNTADTQAKLAELQRSRVVRAAESYYALYSHPTFGGPLRRLRGLVGRAKRALRG